MSATSVDQRKQERLARLILSAPVSGVTPLLGLFGNDDAHPSPAQVDPDEVELKRYGKAYEFHRYDGTGPAFFYYRTPMYRRESAVDGWAKVFSFFSR